VTKNVHENGNERAADLSPKCTIHWRLLPQTPSPGKGRKGTEEDRQDEEREERRKGKDVFLALLKKS